MAVFPVDQTSSGLKREAPEDECLRQAKKKAKLLFEDDDLSDDEQSATVDLNKTPATQRDATKKDSDLQINQEFARRFEHNKRREELQKRKSRLGLPHYSILMQHSGRKVWKNSQCSEG